MISRGLHQVIIGEEVVASKLTIFDLTKQVCDAIHAREKQEKYHGVILLREGLIESIYICTFAGVCNIFESSRGYLMDISCLLNPPYTLIPHLNKEHKYKKMFGLGAEVGISARNIEARGPVVVEGLLTT